MHLFKEKKVDLPEDADEMNLCYLGNDGYQAQGTEKYRKIVGHPEFICKNCGRAAHAAKNLCNPEAIQKNNDEPSEPSDVNH